MQGRKMGKTVFYICLYKIRLWTGFGPQAVRGLLAWNIDCDVNVAHGSG